MQLPPLLTLTLTLALTLSTTTLVTADTIPPESNKWAQLRLFGSPGCETENLLELGVYGYQKNQCQDLSQYGVVQAVNVTAMIDECRLYIYEDMHCSMEKRIAIGDGCVDGRGPYGGLILACLVE